MKLWSLALGLAALICATPAFAQRERRPEEERVVYQHRTLVEFGALRVLGEVQGPGGSYLITRRATRFPLLIKVRQNFQPELERSLESL